MSYFHPLPLFPPLVLCEARRGRGGWLSYCVRSAAGEAACKGRREAWPLPWRPRSPASALAASGQGISPLFTTPSQSMKPPHIKSISLSRTRFWGGLRNILCAKNLPLPSEKVRAFFPSLVEVHILHSHTPFPGCLAPHRSSSLSSNPHPSPFPPLYRAAPGVEEEQKHFLPPPPSPSHWSSQSTLSVSFFSPPPLSPPSSLLALLSHFAFRLRENAM